MTFEELGGLGEFISAIAVVASLVYVASQLRQNTRSLRTASFQTVMQTASEHTRLFIQDAAVTALHLRGIESYSALDAVDKQRFGYIMLNTVWSFEVALSLHEEGIYTDSRLQAQLGHLLSELTTPGGAEWWEENAARMDRKARDYIDAHRSSAVDPSAQREGETS